VFFLELPNLYEGDYSKLIILPIILLIVGLFLIPNVPLGIDLKGGTLIALQSNTDIEVDTEKVAQALLDIGMEDVSVSAFTNPIGKVTEIELETDDRIRRMNTLTDRITELSSELGIIESELSDIRSRQRRGEEVSGELNSKESERDLRLGEANAALVEVRTLSEDLAGFVVKTSVVGDKTNIKKMKKESTELALESKNEFRDRMIVAVGKVTTFDSFSIHEISPTLSGFFIERVTTYTSIAIVIAVIVVFAIFRVVIPSLAVLIGAFSVVVFALGAMALFQIPLTLASFATLMMLVALSLDTDMMLTIKTIKRTEETPHARVQGAFKTGFVMTTTVIAAFLVLLALGIITRIPTYYQIGAVAVAGLIGDLIATWMLNAVLILWFLEGKYKGLYGKLRGMVKR